MLALDVARGHEISIYQPLGIGAMSCKLDTNGLADAVVVARAINEEVDLLVINKFSNQEAFGQGLRHECIDAIISGVPLLTAVPKNAFPIDGLSPGMSARCCCASAKSWWDGGATSLSAWQASARVASRQRLRLSTDHHIRRLDRGREGIADLEPRSSTASW